MVSEKLVCIFYELDGVWLTTWRILIYNTECVLSYGRIRFIVEGVGGSE